VAGSPLRRLAVRDGPHVRFVDVNDVTCIVAAETGVVVHTAGAAFRGSERLARVEERLDGRIFLRAHRSALVNATRIRELRALPGGRCAIVLDDGGVVHATRSFRALLATLEAASFRLPPASPEAHPPVVRLFVGIALPEHVVASVRAFLAPLQPLAALRWSQLDDLHVTTQFLGEQPADRAPAITRALGELPPRAPFPVAVRGIGWFPNAHAPRVFWAGIDAPDALTRLAADTGHALAPLGVPIESRAYSPHLTLARVPPSARLDALRGALAAAPSPDLGTFTVNGFSLYESRPTERGRYHPLATFPLR
jgi:2'-5' RNA ligase